MKEKDYYPAGAYNDPNAPYNQTDDPVDACYEMIIHLHKLNLL